MVLIILLPFALLIFLVGDMISSFLPKSMKPQWIYRCLFALWLFSLGCFGNWWPPTAENSATLMEQVRGECLHWNRSGKAATSWELLTHRHYKRSCREYAIERLGELGPEAAHAVPELIDIFNSQSNTDGQGDQRVDAASTDSGLYQSPHGEDFNLDYDSGDGIYTCRSAIAKTLGAIGQPEAIKPLIEMLRRKSLSPEDSLCASIMWHDQEDYDEAGNRRFPIRVATGPQAIIMGLMQMPLEYHSEILDSLKTVRAEIELSELFNQWSKFEIDRGIRFFEADEKIKSKFRDRNVASNDRLDDTEFENLLDPNYVRPPIKFRVKLHNGKYSKKITSYKELVKLSNGKWAEKPTSISVEDPKTVEGPIKAPIESEDGAVQISTLQTNQ